MGLKVNKRFLEGVGGRGGNKRLLVDVGGEGGEGVEGGRVVVICLPVDPHQFFSRGEGESEKERKKERVNGSKIGFSASFSSESRVGSFSPSSSFSSSSPSCLVKKHGLYGFGVVEFAELVKKEKADKKEEERKEKDSKVKQKEETTSKKEENKKSTKIGGEDSSPPIPTSSTSPTPPPPPPSTPSTKCYLFGRISDIHRRNTSFCANIYISSDESRVVGGVPLSSLFVLAPSLALPLAGDVEGFRGLIDDPLEAFFERLRQGVTDRCGNFFAGVGINQDVIFRSVFDPSLEEIFLLLNYREILERLLNDFTVKEGEREGGEGEEEGKKRGGRGKESLLGRFFEEVSRWIGEEIRDFREGLDDNYLFPLTRKTVAGQLRDGEVQFNEFAVVNIRSIVDTLNAVMDQVKNISILLINLLLLKDLYISTPKYIFSYPSPPLRLNWTNILFSPD